MQGYAPLPQLSREVRPLLRFLFARRLAACGRERQRRPFPPLYICGRLPPGLAWVLGSVSSPRGSVHARVCLVVVVAARGASAARLSFCAPSRRVWPGAAAPAVSTALHFRAPAVRRVVPRRPSGRSFSD